MLRTKYRAVAESAIHTGADTNFGTIRALRRETIRLRKPIEYASRFETDEQRRAAAMTIILAVYRSIDQKLKESYYGYYDPYSRRLLSATGVRTKQEFLTRICDLCGVVSIADKHSRDVLAALDAFADAELMETIRAEIQYLMLMLRDAVQNKRDQSFVSLTTGGSTFRQHFAQVPVFHGNSIRGILRRIVMKDYLDRLGVTKESPYRLPKNTYGMLFTGGTITESTAFEDIAKREQLIRLCPMLGLLGSAIGNMTITGQLMVEFMRPECSENGLGESSFWELVSIDFNTRMDSSKLDNDVPILEEDGATVQMKYEQEVFNKGTVFQGGFALRNSDDKVITAAYYHALRLFAGHGLVGGMSRAGYGSLAVEYPVEITDEMCKPYIDAVEAIKADALEHFCEKIEHAASAA